MAVLNVTLTTESTATLAAPAAGVLELIVNLAGPCSGVQATMSSAITNGTVNLLNIVLALLGVQRHERGRSRSEPTRPSLAPS